MSKDISQRDPIFTWSDWQKAKKTGRATEAEIKLVEACITGVACVLGTRRPNERKPENEIGADLLRYLIKGGCDACDLHDWGVAVYGAYVTGMLDLRMIDAVGMTGFINCHFDTKIVALSAKFNALYLKGSACPGLMAQGITVADNVFLSDGFSATGEVSLAGAVIGGQLNCMGGCFESPEGDADRGADKNEIKYAINAQGAEVKGGVFLRNGFSAKGEVSLAGAVIGGQLDCTGGCFENAKGKAINAQDARMGSFFWREVKLCEGRLSLSGAKAQDIIDDAASWALVEHIYLDGFTYETIQGPLDANMRLRWLERAKGYDGSFSPQPYEQLAAVLLRMGHSEQRREVLLKKERLVRQAVRGRIMARFDGRHPFVAVSAGWLWFWGGLQWAVVGYGLRPFRSVIVLLVLFLMGTFVFHKAYEAGDFAPNSDVILSTPEWRAIAAEAANPAKAWSAKGAAGADYETFNRYAYAADIVIPIISLGQEEAWAPSTTRGDWGWHAWWLRWVLKVMGWIVTALGAAAITGIIRRE